MMIKQLNSRKYTAVTTHSTSLPAEHDEKRDPAVLAKICKNYDTVNEHILHYWSSFFIKGRFYSVHASLNHKKIYGLKREHQNSSNRSTFIVFNHSKCTCRLIGQPDKRRKRISLRRSGKPKVIHKSTSSLPLQSTIHRKPTRITETFQKTGKGYHLAWNIVRKPRPTARKAAEIRRFLLPLIWTDQRWHNN